MRTIEVFDTTLRDGEQSAGVNLHAHEKLEIALQLERFGVDIMEAGFPASSRGDFLAVQDIARTIKNVSVAGLARATQADIDAAWEALKVGIAPRLHVFLATSPIHMEHKLKITPDQVIQTAIDAVQYASARFPVVEWSAEDATRSDWAFLVRIIEKVIDSGAKVINLPDTVGYTTPEEYAQLFQYVRAHVKNIHKAKLSAHCHDDLGMAVANTLAAVGAGVDQIEGTINGIGERAGNASLEELGVALAIRKDVYQIQTRLDLSQTVLTSRMVARLTGMQVPPNKAVVGANAFAHESGIHQDGILKHAGTYEIIPPEMVGLHTNHLVLGKHSGRHAFREKCQELGLRLDETTFNDLFRAFKELTEKKKEVTEDDILALATDLHAEHDGYDLQWLHLSFGSVGVATSTVRLKKPGGVVVEEAATGPGSVEAMYRTIERAVGDEIQLHDYRIQSTTSGADALAEVYVKVTFHGHVVNGRGLDSDVLLASARALLDGVNRVIMKEQRELSAAELA